MTSHFDMSTANPPKATLRGSHTTVTYPPNGVIPFHGFSMYGMWNLNFLYYGG